MMDQRASLQMAAQDDLRVGDLIGYDTLPPFLTFDKWRSLPVLNTQYNVVDIVNNSFKSNPLCF